MVSPPSPGTCVEHKPSGIANETKMVKDAQWVRAAILGASDGLLSTSSLMLGIGAAKDDQHSMVLSGLAGAFAGACSMAVGEFVSVSTQRDIEQVVISKCNETIRPGTADDGGVTIKVEANLTTNTTFSETGELVCTFCPSRSPVMKAITTGDGRGTIHGTTKQDSVQRINSLPNPCKAGAASAMAFLCGSLVPLVAAMVVAEHRTRIIVIVVVTSIALALSGGIGARFGGSSLIVSATRVLIGGWISMAITYCVLKSFNHDAD